MITIELKSECNDCTTLMSLMTAMHVQHQPQMQVSEAENTHAMCVINLSSAVTALVVSVEPRTGHFKIIYFFILLLLFALVCKALNYF